MPVKFSAAEIARKYDSIATRYDRAERIAELLLFNRLRRGNFSRARGDVLEVAAGTGRNLEFYPPGCRLTAIDISQGMLDIARQWANELGRAVDFQLMDGTSLDFPDDHFDTVTSSLSTCTFPDPLAVLREMRRVCKPDGRILLLEHGRSSVRLFGWLQDRLADRQAQAFGCHWNREPRQLIEQAGLRLVSDRTHVFDVVHVVEATP
ncbi:MAG TPA: methyltransferase domain-containing protein [Nitrolancea sp.]